MEQRETTELLQGLQTAFLEAFPDTNYETSLAYKPEFLTNNHENGQKVLSAIERELNTCERFTFCVAFITKSGLTPLLQTLKELEEWGIPGRILTTDYLTFTEPDALKTLEKLQNIRLRMYKTQGSLGFHAKGYIFQKGELLRIIMGSANMTQGALTVNKEWNAKLVTTVQGEWAQKVQNEFENLWNSEHALEFADFYENYCTMFASMSQQRQLLSQAERTLISGYQLQPNSMQLEFVQNLTQLVQRGARRGLLISATGTGKTYASAFGVRDALQAQRKVLFIAHRRQILKQAKDAYRQIFKNSKSMDLLTGEEQDFVQIQQADFVFAM